MEIVLPGRMTVMESHDLALALQHKIEGLPDVERAFVHVDHQRRDGLEHKVERELVTNSSSGPTINPAMGSSGSPSQRRGNGSSSPEAYAVPSSGDESTSPMHAAYGTTRV